MGSAAPGGPGTQPRIPLRAGGVNAGVGRLLVKTNGMHLAGPRRRTRPAATCREWPGPWTAPTRGSQRSGGEGGIRTHGASRLTRSPGARVRPDYATSPWTHLSCQWAGGLYHRDRIRSPLREARSASMHRSRRRHRPANVRQAKAASRWLRSTGHPGEVPGVWTHHSGRRSAAWVARRRGSAE